MPKQYRLRKKLKTKFRNFLGNHPPAEFSANLRRLLLDFMASQVNIGFHIEFNRLLCSLNDLFDLLELAETEIKKQALSPTKSTHQI
jgi:hypothetical protein